MPVRANNLSKLLGLVLALVLLSCQFAVCTEKKTTAPADVQIHQLVESLPKDSKWRDLLRQGLKGDGVRRPWMDDMLKAGTKLAIVTFDFHWTQRGRQVNDWTLEGVQYFRDYDGSEQITNPQQLSRIKTSGLERELAEAALPRAKSANWFEYPRKRHGLGYKDVWLADNEWLPVRLPVNLLNNYEPGLTPLMRAALHGDVARIKELLSNGANVNAVAPNGRTALMCAAMSRSTAAVQALVKAGAKVNAVARDNSTALWWAAVYGNPAAVQCLLDAGAQVNANPKRQGTALLAAVANGRLKNVEVLLKAGADPNARNADGESLLSIARGEPHSTEIIQLLKEAGARE